MNRKIKIMLISSSTGGHAIPVKELQKSFLEENNFRVSVVHSGSEIEKQLFSGKGIFILSSGKLHRHQPWRNFWQFLKIAAAVAKALGLLLYIRPKIIISKGGFNSYPILFWARIFHIAYFIHETDSVMGLANRTFYQKAQKAFVAFPVTEYNLDQSKLSYSGMIVREFPNDKAIGAGRPKILVAGGSQGSAAINECILKSLPALLPLYEIYLSLGTQGEIDLESLQIDPELKKYFHPFSFSLEEFEKILVECNLVISRAGGTIGEVAKLKKPSILVPYPYAAADHQLKNAHFLEKRGGAIVIKQNHLTEKILVDRIKFILKDPNNAKIIGENAAKAIKTDGKAVLISEIKKYLRQK